METSELPPPPDNQKIRAAIFAMERLETDRNVSSWTDADVKVVKDAYTYVTDPFGGIPLFYQRVFWRTRTRLKLLMFDSAHDPEWSIVAEALAIKLPPPSNLSSSAEIDEALATILPELERITRADSRACSKGARFRLDRIPVSLLQQIRSVLHVGKHRRGGLTRGQLERLVCLEERVAALVLSENADRLLFADACDADINQEIARHVCSYQYPGEF